MAASGSVGGASSGRTTSAQRLASSGSGRSLRTEMRCSGAASRSPSSTGSTRSTRSSSAISTFGRESLSPYSISGVVHHAFMPTTAAPRLTVAQ